MRGCRRRAEEGTIVAMTRLPFVCGFLLFAACASAGAGSGSDDVVGDDAPAPDADPGAPDSAPQPIDAMTIDAAPTMVTLSQTTATNIVTPNMLACSSNLNDVPQYTLENHYYRVFKLADFGISGTFTAKHIDFAIEQAETVAGSQTITLRLHTMTGTVPQVANMTLLYGQNVLINDTASMSMGVDLTSPVVVPAGSTLVAEIFAPAHTAANNFFYPGSNTGGETAPGYVRAPGASPAGCGINEPVTFSSVGGASVHLLLSVTGTKP